MKAMIEGEFLKTVRRKNKDTNKEYCFTTLIIDDDVVTVGGLDCSNCKRFERVKVLVNVFNGENGLRVWKVGEGA